MGKLKTRQSVAKRIRVTKKGKMIMRKGGQDHFNSHESSKITRNKRRNVTVHKAELHNLKNFMPYSN